MPGGRDARVLRGRPNPKRPDDYGWNGSATQAKRSAGRPADEIDRSTVKTSASHRTDHYTDRGPSWAAGGPQSDGKSRAPRSYNGHGQIT
jgi:hypothetical protein